MNRTRVVISAALMALATVATAYAGQATGYIQFQGTAQEDAPVDILVALNSEGPIVPYEYSVENRCWFSGRYAGHFDSYERFDLLGPWFEGADGSAQTTVTINLQPVPAGAVCKVAALHNNTTVKGTTTEYSVN